MRLILILSALILSGCALPSGDTVHGAGGLVRLALDYDGAMVEYEQAFAGCIAVENSQDYAEDDEEECKISTHYVRRGFPYVGERASFMQGCMFHALMAVGVAEMPQKERDNEVEGIHGLCVELWFESPRTAGNSL